MENWTWCKGQREFEREALSEEVVESHYKPIDCLVLRLFSVQAQAEMKEKICR